MEPTLEDLELTPRELATARDRVRTLAYEKWCDAGQPCSDGEEYWREAERQWIEHEYVPLRPASRLPR